jgi:hypothetical protein
MADTVPETQPPEPPVVPPEIPRQTDRRAGSSGDDGVDTQTQDDARAETEAALKAEHDSATGKDGGAVEERAETGSLEGRKDLQVFDPADPGRTITDIDDIRGGVLWENKSATFAGDNAKWVDKQVTDKLEKYVEARQHLPGYENAPIGLRMTEPGVDPALRTEIEHGIDRFRQAHPGVDVRLEFAE